MVLDLCKIWTPQLSSNLYVLRPPEWEKMGFTTNGSGFDHQKRFLQNQEIHFPSKLCEIQKNVNK